MTSVYDLFKQTLRNNGYSLTKTRELVFEALEHEEPLTMAELLAKIETLLDRASLYRTIALFERLGIAERLQIGWKYKIELTDTFNYHHHHITCEVCGLTVPLRENSNLETTIDMSAREYGFLTKNHQLEIQGICPSCQKDK